MKPTKHGWPLTVITALGLLLVSGGIVQVAVAQGTGDEAEITAVVEQLSTGIKMQDAEMILSVLENPNVPAFISHNGYSEGSDDPRMTTGGELAQMNANMVQPGEKKFSNIAIDISNGVATMRADYEFVMNGAAVNTGTEMWTLIKKQDGWRIVSMVFTM